MVAEHLPVATHDFASSHHLDSIRQPLVRYALTVACVLHSVGKHRSE